MQRREGERVELYRREKCVSSAPLTVSSCQIYIYMQKTAELYDTDEWGEFKADGVTTLLVSFVGFEKYLERRKMYVTAASG